MASLKSEYEPWRMGSVCVRLQANLGVCVLTCSVGTSAAPASPANKDVPFQYSSLASSAKEACFTAFCLVEDFLE